MNLINAEATVAAGPSFIGGKTARIAAGASSNVALPAGLHEGDMVFVLVGSDNALDGSKDGILSAGYRNLDISPADATPGVHFACKIMSTVPDATVRVKADPNREVVVAIHAWRGIAPNDYGPLLKIASAYTGMPNPPSASSTVPGSVHLIGGVIDDQSMTPIAPPGFGNLVCRRGNGAAGTSATVMLASRLLVTPGSIDPAAFGGASIDAWRAYHLVLPPVAASSRSAEETLFPAKSMGYGASVTGGWRGKFVRITSLSDSASTVGSLRWALNQHAGQPLHLAFCVEGKFHHESVLNITRPNVTFSGQFAPGNGVWITGERWEVERGNIIIEHLQFLGNDTSPSGNSDCIRIGDFGGSHDVDGVIVRNCVFKHGGDEVFAITPRANGASTGPRVVNVSIHDNIVADATSTSDSAHHFLFFVGDGSERISVYNNLLSTGSGRFPLFKEFSSYIEWFNNALYNGNPNISNASGKAQVDYIGNLIRLGPLWSNANGPISLDSRNDFYESGTLIDSKMGKASTHLGGGLYNSNLPNRPARFSPTSGLVPAAATQVEGRIVATCGPMLHGGVRPPLAQQTIDDFVAGNAPSSLASHPGPVPRSLGASYEPTNGNGVPIAYLAKYPSDTNPESIISGGVWDNRMVCERMACWHIRKIG